MVAAQARGAVAGRISTEDKWWEKGDKIDNLLDIADTPQFLDALSGAGDRLVIVDFYAQWYEPGEAQERWVFLRIAGFSSG